MVVARLAAALLAMLVLTGTVQARSEAAPSAPQGLKPFLLRPDESERHTFPRTPSFAWNPVAGAMRYEFELSKAQSFHEGAIFWSDANLRAPAVSVPLALPWMTGTPYAVYARVRAITKDGVSPWSEPFGFNLRWETTPRPLDAYPGLSRWSVVEGASGYHVWFPDIRKRVATRTNAVDHREFYSFHQSPDFSGTVRWRVRAVRSLYGSVPTGLPTVTYGPWSPLYTTTNPPVTIDVLRTVAALSDDAASTNAKASLHELTPALAFSGNRSSSGEPFELYRAYVFSDADCVNVVHRGAVVGSPAYAPRTTGPLDLPVTVPLLNGARGTHLKDGKETKTFMADGSTVQPTEQDAPPKQPSAGGEEKEKESGGGETGDPGDPSSTPPENDPSLPSTPGDTGAPVDLWDSGWPNGRFYWTVVPVRIEIVAGAETALVAAVTAGATSITVANAAEFGPGNDIAIGNTGAQQIVTIASKTGSTITFSPALASGFASATPVRKSTQEVQYVEAEMPQDACQASRIQAFGKGSTPVSTLRNEPFVSGLSPLGRLVAASSSAPRFYGAPLVAWEPALGADQYQVQWSKSSYPWRKAGEKLTYATSSLLPLQPGRWWYRVRGINFHLPGTARAMSWSRPVEVVVAKPSFSVVGRAFQPARAPQGYASWTRYGSGFSVALPKTWVALAKTDARIAPLLGPLAEAGSPLRLVAIDPSGFGGFATNVNVLAGKRPAGLTAANFVERSVADARRIASGRVSARLVRLPAGRAVRLEYVWKPSRGSKGVQHVQYRFLGESRQYQLSFATLPSLRGRYAGAFATAARTFRHAG